MASVLLKHSYGDAGLLCSVCAFDNGRDLGTRRRRDLKTRLVVNGAMAANTDC